MAVDFFPWRDMHAMRKKQGEKAGPLECYGSLVRFFEQRGDGMSVLSCNAELEWYKFGNPYYKIFPSMIGQLMRVNIDIAGQYLHMPFPTIEVRLPKSDPLREYDGAPAVCALLVHSDGGLANGWAQRGPRKHRDYSLVVHYQLDCDLDKDWMGWYFLLPIDKSRLISEQFREALPKSQKYRDDYVPGDAFVEGLVRMAVATCFFGLHAHELVCPDIPQRFIERWHKAKKDGDKTEAAKLLDKAKRLGMFGWKVGSEIDLPCPVVRHFTDDSRGADGTRGELTAGHVRSGHLRLQPYGPRDKPKEQRHELIFVAPTIVRPDLPLRDIRGFRIRRPAARAAQPGE